MPEMAMFPLGTVLLPGMVLPLQVFEPRYRTMMERCMAGSREFGVVLIERGSEVGGGDVRSMTGTVAQVGRAEEAPDGRWAVMALGTRRIRVTEWLDDDPYPRALVEDWPDEPVDDEGALQEAFAARSGQLRRLMAMANELGNPAQPFPDLVDRPLEGSYQLAMLSPLGSLDQQRLLCAPGPADRLIALGALLGEVEDDLRARLAGG